jgi:hypothetical protein
MKIIKWMGYVERNAAFGNLGILFGKLKGNIPPGRSRRTQRIILKLILNRS